MELLKIYAINERLDLDLLKMLTKKGTKKRALTPLIDTAYYANTEEFLIDHNMHHTIDG